MRHARHSVYLQPTTARASRACRCDHAALASHLERAGAVGRCDRSPGPAPPQAP